MSGLNQNEKIDRMEGVLDGLESGVTIPYCGVCHKPWMTCKHGLDMETVTVVPAGCAFVMKEERV